MLSSNNSGEDDSENSDKASVTLESAQISVTAFMTNALIQAFGKIFNPQAVPSMETSDELFEVNPDTIKKVVELIKGTSIPAPLLERVPEFVGEPSSSTHSELKSSDFQLLKKLIVRVGMHERPDYFELGSETLGSEDAGLNVGFNLFREFTQKGPFDFWLGHIRKIIEEKELSSTEKGAALGFLEMTENFSKSLASDPFQDPLGKYVDPNDMVRIRDLAERLELTRDNELRKEFIELDDRIRGKRDEALKEGSEYLFSLMKGMSPELSDIPSMEAMIVHQRQEGDANKRLMFEAYILSEYGKRNIFEPNILREFNKKLCGKQYGPIFYKIVCESFEEQYKNSEVHQKVREIWSVFQIDTIHNSPKEARSRMPGKSFDGLPASNFGYKMDDSPAYQNWISNQLVRATGDIIMDSFHIVVDFGVRLEINVFLERLKRYIIASSSEEDLLDFYRSVHEYDDYLMPFQFYLLEKTFSTKHIAGKDVGAMLLERVSGNFTVLLGEAKKALVNFQEFSLKVFRNRPSNDGSAESKEFLDGFVFGIGFNGERFNSPRYHEKGKSEICLAFSKEGRNDGAYLFLSILECVSKSSDKLRIVFGDGITSAKKNYERYGALMKRHICLSIKRNYSLFINFRAPLELEDRAKKEVESFETYLEQIENKIPFEQLNSSFKVWIENTSHWYYIPRDIDIGIPEEMPVEEYGAQFLARNLLFDAITKRRFSIEYPHLMASFFLHWKDEIIEKFGKINPEIAFMLRNKNFLIEVPEEFKSVVTDEIDKLIWSVHLELEKVWVSVIQEEFEIFMAPQNNKIDSKLRLLGKSIAKQEGNALKSGSSSKAAENLTRCQNELKQLQNEKQKLAKQPSELFQEDHENFREVFFNKRGIAQCVEPVFARALGHDRFFPVFISKKVGKTKVMDQENHDIVPLQLGNLIPQDVIAPCNKRCQHHALGHLYTGDMLSYQSVDRLDEMRKVHGLGEVPNYFMDLEKIQEFFTEANGNSSSSQEQASFGSNILFAHNSNSTAQAQLSLKEDKSENTLALEHF